MLQYRRCEMIEFECSEHNTSAEAWFTSCVLEGAEIQLGGLKKLGTAICEHRGKEKF